MNIMLFPRFMPVHFVSWLEPVVSHKMFRAQFAEVKTGNIPDYVVKMDLQSQNYFYYFDFEHPREMTSLIFFFPSNDYDTQFNDF